MIIVIGEALIDLIEDKDQAGSYQAVVGGANANVAIALARAEARVQLLARISGDAFGQKIRNRLLENNVGLDYAVLASEPSSLAIASIGNSGGASYSFYVNQTADWFFTPQELPESKVLQTIGAKALQFGCLTMAMEPGNAVIENWAREFFQNKQLTISHDVNVRPAVGFDANQERIRVERLNAISSIIKASDDDINWLYNLAPGTSVDPIAWDWIAGSDKVVFVTRGSEGVSIYRKDKQRLDVASRKVKVQDTVGAGDTFCANMLAELLKIDALGADPEQKLARVSNQQLVEIARIAGIAASMACEKVGAEPPTRKELEKVIG
jgi:fructokinase